MTKQGKANPEYGAIQFTWLDSLTGLIFNL